MEQQLCAGLAEGEVAEFVDDNEIMSQQALDQAPALAGGLFLFELVDEINKVEEAPARPGADDGRSDCDRQVGFARAGRDSDMAPGFWRAKRRFTTPFIRSRE